MAKVAILGAGGYAFPIRLAADVLSHEATAGSEICMMDINRKRVEFNTALLKRYVEAKRLPSRVWATTDLEAALDGADYVMVTWQVGGLESYAADVNIPRKYGVDQPVGDTHGPGGVMRFLRSYKSFMTAAETMRRVCPQALMINYANPMAMNCWGVIESGVKIVGLCHSVQGTSRLLAEMAGVTYEECSYTCYGINHQAWFVDFRHRDKDIYPLIRRALEKRYPSPVGGTKGSGKAARGMSRGHDKDLAVQHGDIYHIEWVRTEIMRTFGYFHSESSHHGSEYIPWVRKNAELVKAYLPFRWDYYELCKKVADPKNQEKLVARLIDEPQKPSAEYAATIINSMETGQPSVIYGNVSNYGAPGTSRKLPAGHLIPNLPQDACVELACLVDRNGIQPTSPGALPSQCAAMNMQHVMVQRMAVEAAREGDARKALQAISMDPLTSALLTLPQIRSMTAELFKAHRKHMPMFRGRLPF